MKHLRDVKNADALLNGEVELFQKVDGANLNLRRERGQIKYYGREWRNEIDKVKRVTMDFYEEGIEYLESIDLSFVKEGDWIEFEYFGSRVTPVIKVTRKPKHGLIVLRASMGNEVDVARKLDVDPNPKIFKGKLNDKQKEIILSGKFTKDDIKYFNPNYRVALNPTRIEGLILRAKGQIYKVTDPDFTDTIKSKKAARDESDEYSYFKVLLEMVARFPWKIPKNFKYTPEAFLNLVFKNVQDGLPWILDHKKDMEPYNYGQPFIKPFTEFNWKFVPSELQSVIKSNPWIGDFVRLSLTYLGKETKRGNRNIMDFDMRDRLNDISRRMMKEGINFEVYMFIHDYMESLKV